MDIENHIKAGVLEQDHLADILIGKEDCANEIRSRVLALLDQGLVDLYTYEKGSIVVFGKPQALSIASKPESWSWQSMSGKMQLYFLSPAQLSK